MQEFYDVKTVYFIKKGVCGDENTGVVCRTPLWVNSLASRLEGPLVFATVL